MEEDRTINVREWKLRQDPAIDRKYKEILSMISKLKYESSKEHFLSRLYLVSDPNEYRHILLLDSIMLDLKDYIKEGESIKILKARKAEIIDTMIKNFRDKTIPLKEREILLKELHSINYLLIQIENGC